MQGNVWRKQPTNNYRRLFYYRSLRLECCKVFRTWILCPNQKRSRLSHENYNIAKVQIKRLNSADQYIYSKNSWLKNVLLRSREGHSCPFAVSSSCQSSSVTSHGTESSPSSSYSSSLSSSKTSIIAYQHHNHHLQNGNISMSSSNISMSNIHKMINLESRLWTARGEKTFWCCIL